MSRTSKSAQRLVLDQCDAGSSSNSSCEQVQRVGRLRTHNHVQRAVPTRLCDSGDLKEEPFALYVAGALAGKKSGVTMMVEK